MIDFEKLNIDISKIKTQGKTICPNCSHLRRKYKDPCLSVNTELGTYYCHHCGWTNPKGNKVYSKPDITTGELSERTIKYFQTRKISLETLQAMRITETITFMPQAEKEMQCINFNYYRDNKLINIKYRDAKKNFLLYKDAELIFYNIDSIKDTEEVIITEGEMDCLSFIEAGLTFCVSVPNGANINLNYINNCYEYFANKKKIYICADNDEPGVKLKEELTRRFGKDICYFIEFPYKDANELIIKTDVSELKYYFNNARSLPLDDVQYLNDLRETMIYEFQHGKPRGTTTYFESLNPHFNWKKGEVTLFHGIGNHGKALSIETDIPTVTGWKKMKDIIIDDELFDEKGEICKVKNVTDIMYNRECYEIIFNDGTIIIADAEHKWLTETAVSRRSQKASIKRNIKKAGIHSQISKKTFAQIKNTKEISETLIARQRGVTIEYNHSVDYALPINPPYKKYIINPYILGVWLGDGSSADSQIYSNDPQIINNINNFGENITKGKELFTYRIKGTFKARLRSLNLLKNKHIPLDYLRGSAEQRIELLKGLMDTDGYVGTDGICEFTNTNKVLAENVLELVNSVGLKGTLYTGNATINGRFISKKYRIFFKPHFSVFKLTRKNIRHKNKCKNNYRFIVSCNKIESVPVKCIEVNSNNHLYLCTKSFIATHNTEFVHQICLLKSVKEGDKWGVYSPELYPANEFYDSLIHSFLGKNIDPKYNNQCTQPEYEIAMDFIQQHFFYIYPESARPTPEFINKKFKELILKEGITGGIIDPFNQLDNDIIGRDDLYISNFLTNEKRFALKHDFYKIIIAHPKNLVSNAKNGYDCPKVFDLHGGAMWNNKCDNIIAYHRPNYYENPMDTTCEINVQKIKKQKIVGIPGKIILNYDRSSARYFDNGNSPFANELTLL